MPTATGASIAPSTRAGSEAGGSASTPSATSTASGRMLPGISTRRRPSSSSRSSSSQTTRRPRGTSFTGRRSSGARPAQQLCNSGRLPCRREVISGPRPPVRQGCLLKAVPAVGLGVAAVLATLAPPALGGTPAREGAKLAPAVRAALDAGRNQRVLVLFRGEAEPALEPGLSRVQGIARVRRALERTAAADQRDARSLLRARGIP